MTEEEQLSMSESETIAVLREVIRSDPYHMQFSPLLTAYDTLRAERDALRKVDDAMVGRFLRAYAECEGERQQTFTHRIGVRAALDAALAVQP